MINLDEYQLDEFSISKFKSMKSFWENKRKFKIYDYIISDKKDNIDICHKHIDITKQPTG